MSTTPTSDDHVDIGGERLGYRRTGAGPDLVFVHGWPLTKETWRNVVRHLDGFTCHLIDLPGCGTSVPTGGPLSLRNHVNALVRAIDALHLDRLVLVGQDSGGMIARFAAVELGARVEALIVVGSEIPFEHPKLIEHLQKAIRLPGSNAIARRALRNDRLLQSKYVLGSCFGDRSLASGPFKDAVLKPAFADRAATARQFELLASYDTGQVDELATAHPKIMCPTLLVWGEQDPFFPPAKARAMAEQFGGPTRFELVPNARLLVYEEFPERFAALCAGFLADVGVGQLS